MRKLVFGVWLGRAGILFGLLAAVGACLRGNVWSVCCLLLAVWAGHSLIARYKRLIAGLSEQKIS